MEKLFDIVPTKKANRKKKYPYNVEYPDGLAVPVPSQYDFSDSAYIRTKGCIIAAFYMGLRFAGKKKSMKSCLNYLQEHYDKGNRANYNLRHVADAINRLAPGSPAKFYKKPSKEDMKKALKAGHMILYTERNPTHTVVLLWNGRKIKRFSDGKYKSVTLAWEIKKRSTHPYYGGCVIVKRK